jgi:uncharacterized protein (TIGR03118 family)
VRGEAPSTPRRIRRQGKHALKRCQGLVITRKFFVRPPLNVQDINGKVYVTYAPAGHTAQTTASLGQGVVNVFDENGVLQQRLITGGNLAAPWGIALAPSSFGVFGGDLLVGNFSFSHSFISAFDPTTGVLEGTIPIDLGANSPGGLWAA